MIRFIAALDNKRGIADEHGIPWQGKIPTDVAHFRKSTIHGIVMMGYGWYVEQKLPLPERRNLVATTNSEELRAGFERVTDARTFLQETKEDVWVGGGAGLFASTIDLADELVLTLIEADFRCTKFFPPYEDAFELVESSAVIVESGISYRFTRWSRRNTL
ncbi:MAG TPA: dihydrofolate reductase [Candidatus Saccharibacteria bacterium]|nr:dihydrofolate reductase [Candidatus Saccharibacteria bacterium]